MVLEVGLWMNFDRLRMFLTKGIKLLQVGEFHLFFVEFFLSLEFFFEFFVRSKQFEVLKVIVDDWIFKIYVYFQFFFAGLFLGLFQRMLVLFLSLILLGLVDKFTKRVFIVIWFLIWFFVVLHFRLFLLLLGKRLLDRVFAIGLAKKLWTFAQLGHWAFLVILSAFLKWGKVEVCHLSVWLHGWFKISYLSVRLHDRL